MSSIKKSKNLKDKNNKKVASPLPEIKNDQLELLTQNLEEYKSQVKDLEQQLKKSQIDNDQLKSLASKYDDTLKYSLSDKKDIIEYLTQELDTKVEEILDLKDRFTHLNLTKISCKTQLEAKLREQEKLNAEKLEKLESANLLLESKLSIVENYIKDKENLDKKLNDYAEEVENLKEENQEKIYQLEKLNLIEKNKLRNEMIEKLNELANEFRNAFHQQMNNTTKKIIKENYSLNIDLKKMSETTNKLLNENEILKENVNNFFVISKFLI